MKTVLSGIRPTGQLHLGNYFGALRNFVKMQHENRCFFFIADYHSLTTHPNPTLLHDNIKNVLSEYLAAGIDPNVATIYIQSDVPQVAELSLLLSMHAYLGELERTASFKEKIRKHSDNINAGLLCYPVLMAADILLHRADYVPVGKDQEQHLEMTRKFARRFNTIYGVDYLPESMPYNFGAELTKVPGLDGSGKMGKSEGNGLYLADSDDVIRKKVMKAVTSGEQFDPAKIMNENCWINDNEPNQFTYNKHSFLGKNYYMQEAVYNIFTIMNIVSSDDTLSHFLSDYENGAIRYGDMKKQLAEDIIKVVGPIREKIEDIRSNDRYLHEVVTAGAEKARASANETLRNVREIMGIKPF